MKHKNQLLDDRYMEGMLRAMDICLGVVDGMNHESAARGLTDRQVREALANAAGAGMCYRTIKQEIERAASENTIPKRPQ